MHVLTRLFLGFAAADLTLLNGTTKTSLSHQGRRTGGAMSKHKAPFPCWPPTPPPIQACHFQPSMFSEVQLYSETRDLTFTLRAALPNSVLREPQAVRVFAPSPPDGPRFCSLSPGRGCLQFPEDQIGRICLKTPMGRTNAAALTEARPSSPQQKTKLPANDRRFATIHSVCPFPRLPGHI